MTNTLHGTTDSDGSGRDPNTNNPGHGLNHTTPRRHRTSMPTTHPHHTILRHHMTRRRLHTHTEPTRPRSNRGRTMHHAVQTIVTGNTDLIPHRPLRLRTTPTLSRPHGRHVRAPQPSGPDGYADGTTTEPTTHAPPGHHDE